MVENGEEKSIFASGRTAFHNLVYQCLAQTDQQLHIFFMTNASYGSFLHFVQARVCSYPMIDHLATIETESAQTVNK